MCSASEYTRYCALVIHLIQPSVIGSTESTAAPATPALATSHLYAGYAFPQAKDGATQSAKPRAL
jgi:hypothetical protein